MILEPTHILAAFALGFIIGFAEPTKIGIISSYLLCGTFCLLVHIEFKEDK